MHDNSVLLFRKYVVPFVSSGAHVLEIAPDSDPSTYRRQVSVPVTWSTADLASQVDLHGDRLWGTGGAAALTYTMQSEYAIPAPDGTFDVVLSGNVIEHVRRPWIWMQELARVCRPGGVVATITPVSWPYHEAPIDCYRIYPEGMRTLCEDAGLTVELALFESLEVTTAHVVSRQDVQRRQRSPGARTEPRETIGWMAADNRVRQRCDRPETRGDQDDVAGSWWGHVRVFSPPDALCSHTFRTVKPREAAPPVD